MNFNIIFTRSIRLLLLPFALLYGLVIAMRNWLYDKKVLRSATFNFPLICVGNLSVGGTGKSPMVEYLVELLQSRFKVATLSRGYKRKTKGYGLANETTTALEIGDEPMQFHLKFPQVAVAVGEERLVAIPQLLHDRPGTEVIILDDAFQHRAISAGLNILLTDYNNLFYNDWFLPTGDLRDERRSYKRAHIIVVTKCPATLGTDEKNKIVKQIKLQEQQHLFFTAIQYGQPYHIITKQPIGITAQQEVLLVCGIANPQPLKDYLTAQVASFTELSYSDHHIFTIDDLKEMRKKYGQLQGINTFILTTEKDAVRLLKFSEALRDLPLYVLPVKHQFLFGEGAQFNQLLHDFVAHSPAAEV
ncbi:tetraacyldisaccharide 4'-kinase [Ilyomonas limi]|uniref:Tetraacyldisaccharide 4'-kinase n=1 Tax=Ilyomonas limi TaxID=2575867 RepID=A0A4U3L912_9BACT|nr:tetraacyldisaccharide 4'-kinase [Ilyomonas limi]TKK71811.1 tetraacyldisaccharide 4'-kinase [Ilyomonas limi]